MVSLDAPLLLNESASVNVMPRNIFEYLRLANLRNTNILVEMADMTKKAPLEIDQLADEYKLGIGKKDICLIRYGNNVKISIEITHISGMTMDLKKRNVMKWE
ncbi:hypothetical protein Tco_0223178 [Tanacetum coccineum]